MRKTILRWVLDITGIYDHHFDKIRPRSVRSIESIRSSMVNLINSFVFAVKNILNLFAIYFTWLVNIWTKLPCGTP